MSRGGILTLKSLSCLIGAILSLFEGVQISQISSVQSVCLHKQGAGSIFHYNWHL